MYEMHKILIISDNPEQFPRFLRLNEVQLEIITFKSSAYNDKTQYADMLEKIENPNAISCVVCEPLYNAPYAFLLRKNGYGGPFIVIPHVNPYPLKELLETALLTSCFDKDDVFIVGSEASKNMYKKLFPDINISVIPTYGIDTDHYKKIGRHEAREKLKLPENSKILLYTGRLSPDKNIGSLFAVYRAIQKSFDAKINLILSYVYKDDPYINFLLDRYGDAGITVEHYSSDQMPYLYNAADIFVSGSTSYFETFGRSPLESIACGTPAVIPAWSSFKEILNDRSGKLISVDFFEYPIYDKFSYAMVNLQEFKDTCYNILLNDNYEPELDVKYTFTESKKQIEKKILEALYLSKVGKERIDLNLRGLTFMVDKVMDELGIKTADQIFDIVTDKNFNPLAISDDLQREIFYYLFRD